MVIELYGLPATGKTTLADLLVKQTCCVSPPKMRGWFDALGCSLRYIIRRPVFCLRFLVLIWEQTQGNAFGRKRIRLFWYKFVHRYLYILAKQTKINSMDQSKICILDEGWLQVALGIFEKPCPEIESFLRDIELPAAVVILGLPEGDWMERMAEFGGRSRRFMGEAYASIWLRHLPFVYRGILDAFEERAKCPVIHADTSLAPNCLLSQVIFQLRNEVGINVSH